MFDDTKFFNISVNKQEFQRRESSTTKGVEETQNVQELRFVLFFTLSI